MQERHIHSRSVQGYGWIPDLPDARDYIYAAPPMFTASAPPKVDLQPHCPAVYDQGALGSCTANAISAAIQFERMKQNFANAAATPDATPSRLFIYYNERAMEGTVSFDAGAQIRDGIKSVARLGVCFEGGESSWPYDIGKFAVQPPAPDYAVALDNQVLQYSRVIQDLPGMKGCLASGYPFVFGFTVYQSFRNITSNGIVPMPKPGERAIGGHAVLAVGYDDATQRFKVRNSWGTDWGQGGYCWMPYAYLSNPRLAADFWTVRLVEGG